MIALSLLGRIRKATLLALVVLLLGVPNRGVAEGKEASPVILHTAVVGSYGYWAAQGDDLETAHGGYGATLRYLRGEPGGTRLGFGVTWVRSALDVTGGGYEIEGRSYTDDLELGRLGFDLYYGFPENYRGNVPYLLLGGGRLAAEGQTRRSSTVETAEPFWEVGVGMINGGSQYLAFGLELKYIGRAATDIRSDSGLIELSLSMGYNW